MLNHITIMGRLTRDPELRYTQSQIPVASFTVAVDRDYSGRDGGEKQTDFIDCAAWRQTVEFVSRYFRKGSMAVVSGRLQSRKWQDRDGNNRTSWEVIADSCYFGESKKDSGSPQGGYQQTAAYGAGQRPASYGGYAPPAQSQPPAPPYQQTAFTELDDDNGDLPF